MIYVMVALGETITVINKSGKVVSNSKHLISVFKEAKSAYRERKAEIRAERNAALEQKKLMHSMKTLRIEDDTRSRASGRTHRSSRSHRQPKPPFERGYTDSFCAKNDIPRHHSPSHRHFEQDLAGDVQRQELTRRHTDGAALQSQYRTPRSNSEPQIDMDLAYGELPPPLPTQNYDDGELREKASKLTILLDEANCLQYSVTAMIENLQKNPEALAAVALTLAEISNIMGKMGPGVLTAMKGSFPAVVALLASPQFMIAAGVGVGVTIVALGGYKIIKKIKAKKETELEEPLVMDELVLDELQDQELSRIEMWRRGIADAEADSAGTTVDGEFITPGASKHLIAAGILEEDDLKSRRSSHRRESKSKPKTAKSTASSTKTSRSGKDDKEKKKKKKQPSPLRMLFQPR